MNALGFAWRSLVRQPARTTLGVLGVAAVGALLFDMLMLSTGLITSMRDLLEQGGWDVRVSAGDLPSEGPRMSGSLAAADAIAALPSVRAVLLIRTAHAELERLSARPLRARFNGATVHASTDPGDGIGPPWTILRGRQPEGTDEMVIDETIASAMALELGSEVRLRVSCVRDLDEALPASRLQVVGVAEFPFAVVGENTVGGTLDSLRAACGGNVDDDADFILAASAGDPDQAAAAVRLIVPDLNVATNEALLGRIQETGFTYFRQISTVLTTVTVSFAVLLITVLLTVSVNQRLGEVAALRALGFDARVGEVQGEYCPGRYSINLGGRWKVMGVGQRLRRGVAHVGGVVAVSGHEAINEVLTPVYRALSFDWDPAVTGSLQAARSGTTTAEVSEALLAELSSFGEIAKGGLNRSTLELAARLLPDHLPTEYPTPS